MQFFQKALCVLVLAGVTAGSMWSSGFGERGPEQEYERITNSEVKGLELLKQITDFEAANPGHFESKVALGNIWLLLGDDIKAVRYLLRAQDVLGNCGNNAAGKEHKRVMYYSLALIRGNNGRYDDALTYINKAIAVQDEGVYQFLKANILTVQQKHGEAIVLFDAAWEKYPDSASENDIKCMVGLYNSTGRYGDAANMLDAIYDKGRYAAGFGVWASTVYEKAGQSGKALLAAWLDLDYGCSMTDLPLQDVKTNVDALEAYLRKNNTWAESEQDMNVVRGVMGLGFDKDIPPHQEMSDIRHYAYLRMVLLRPNPEESHLYGLQNMEGFFMYCPAYYAAIFSAVAKHWPEKRAAYLPTAEKIITLGASPALDKKARHWIGETLGLDSAGAERLLLLTETEALLEEYQRSRKSATLEPLFGLFELPDNAYVLSSLVLAKQNSALLRGALLARQPIASPRLKERIEFLLQ
jgi:tetratricopeptide (TPR) repeat protein